MACFASYACPMGIVTVGYEDGAVVSLKITKDTVAPNDPSTFSDQIAMELQEYFEGERTCFTFPIRLDGTDFQKAIWQQLRMIPYGQTRTYGQIAADIGRPKAARAVGMACNQNPVWIAIPCHRVLGRNGALTGYAGGLDLKQKLLKLEHRNA